MQAQLIRHDEAHKIIYSRRKNTFVQARISVTFAELQEGMQMLLVVSMITMMAIEFSTDNPQNVSNDQLMQHIFLG